MLLNCVDEKEGKTKIPAPYMLGSISLGDLEPKGSLKLGGTRAELVAHHWCKIREKIVLLLLLLRYRALTCLGCRLPIKYGL